MKNILIVQGGGRPGGNTEQLIGAFVKGAEQAGHRTEIVSLLRQEVKGCLGCNVCRQGRPCVQRDAFHEIVPKIQEADCLVFASPLYYWTVSARLKAFIERFYSVARQDPFRDRGTLLAGGCGGSSGRPAIEKTDWLEKAFDFGKNLY